MWPSFKGYHERNAPTHALMTLLSMASVTFGDAVGESNKTLLMRLCRSDGMLLKADRPATAMDAQFQAMMFQAWPGKAIPPPHPPPHHHHPPGPPSGPRPSLTLGKCVVGAPGQTFTLGGEGTSGALRLAGSNPANGCVGVGGCGTVAGSEVHLYNNSLGNCGTVSTCHGKNEQWTISGGVIRSVLTPTLCLKVAHGGKQGQEATLAKCDPKDAAQGFTLKKRQSAPRGHRDEAGGGFTLVSANDATECLTAFWPHQWRQGGEEEEEEALIAEPLRGAFSWDDQAQEEAFVEAAFPSATTSLSDGYRHAYATSAALMGKLEGTRQHAEAERKQRAAAGEQCDAGFGAPQGPLGEVYSTHTTVSGMTWRYVVGVQLSADYNISASALAIHDPEEEHVSVAFDEATTFKPTHSADVKVFGGKTNAQLTLKQSDGEMCETAPRFKITTKCFPYQWHTIAPVSPNGWSLVGEVGKFMPVSNQRLASVSAVASGGFTLELKGAAGEAVTMGAVDVKSGKAPVYAEATIGADGTATLQLGQK